MKPIFNSSDKKVIFFDLNDTLIDRELGFTEALLESLGEFTARWESQDWNPIVAVEAYQKEWARRSVPVKKTRGQTKKRRLVKTKNQEQLSVLKKSLEGSPFEVTDSFLRTLLRRTKEIHGQHPRLFPEVQLTLEQLKQQYQLAIISNGKLERLIQILQYAGLDHIFPSKALFVPSSSRTKKPHPALFQRALKAMDVQPHQAVMVGNSWNNDIFGGNRCDIDTIWIQPRNQKIHMKRIGRNKVIMIARIKQLTSIFNS